MLFAPTETDGFQLVHTAKQYLELVSNSNRVRLETLLPEWTGEMMDIDDPVRGSNQAMAKVSMEELRRRIAASDLEIDTALEMAFAVELDGAQLVETLT